MEYKPANLPVYWPIKSRQDFSNIPVQSGYVLLFSQDGMSITMKHPDGSHTILIGKESPSSVLFITNNDDCKGSYVATQKTFNGAPVYELT